MNCKTSVSDWQESISALADDKFFGIIRMYLGEIKTPYNKQRLIEQLAGFIKNEENSNNLVNLLDEFDIKVITAICHIYNPTKQNISDFFTGDYTMAELYTELSNLVQRLILFTKKDPYSQKEFYYVNPLLWEKIEPYIGIQKILVEPELAKPNTKDVFSINPNFITAIANILSVSIKILIHDTYFFWFIHMISFYYLICIKVVIIYYRSKFYSWQYPGWSLTRIWIIIYKVYQITFISSYSELFTFHFLTDISIPSIKTYYC